MIELPKTINELESRIVLSGFYKDWLQKPTLFKNHKIEIRIDEVNFNKIDLKRFRPILNRVIITDRNKKVSIVEKTDTLIRFIEQGVAYVDFDLSYSQLQWRKITAAAKLNGTNIIASYHNFIKTPTAIELNKITKKLLDKGSIAKIACQVNNSGNLFDLINLNNSSNKIVSIGMGDNGIFTRIAGPILGAPLTYCCLRNSIKTGPGQLAYPELIKIYKQMGYK